MVDRQKRIRQERTLPAAFAWRLMRPYQGQSGLRAPGMAPERSRCGG